MVVVTLFFRVRIVRQGTQADKTAQNPSFYPFLNPLTTTEAFCEHLGGQKRWGDARKTPAMASFADIVHRGCSCQADNYDILALF